MLDLYVHSKRGQVAVRIVHVDIELILSQVLDVGVLLFTLFVDEGQLLLGLMVESELVTHFPRVNIMLASSSEFQCF